MGRALVWGLGLLLAAGLAWTLFGQGEGGGSGPSLDPLGDPEATGEDLGPGLKVREGARMLEEETESGDVGVRGIVLDEGGRPLAGIRVTAARAVAGGSGQRHLHPYFEPPPVPAPASAEALTDATGMFLLEGLVAGKSYHFQAVVEPPRYSGRQRTTARHSRQLIKLLVGEGSAFRGRVVDAAGAGLLAWVNATSNSRDGLPRWLYRYWSVPHFQTKPDGRFALHAVPNGIVTFNVTVLGRGQRTNIRVETPAEGEVELRFEDASGATVTGRVTDTSGRAIAGAQVAVASRHVHGGWQRQMTTRAATTDAGGTYTVERLTPGAIAWVLVEAPGFIPPSNLAANRPLEEGRPTRVDVILSRGATIVGRVLDEAGAPLAGAEVSLGRRQGNYSPGMNISRKVTSASDGQFELTTVPLGQGTLVATAVGYYLPPEENAPGGPPWMRAQTGRPFDATEEGQRIPMDIVLKAGVPVEGIVTREDGSPVAGAAVELRPQNNSYFPGFPGQQGRLTTASTADGTFAFPGMAPSKSLQLQAKTTTHLSDWVKFTLPRPETDGPLKVVVKEGASVAGTATTTAGTAVIGMTVTVSGATSNAVTRVDGTYEVAGIPAGKKTVRASVTPRPPSAEKKVELEWGQRLGGVDLVIPPALAIKGVVVDEQGAPADGVVVTAYIADKNNRSRGRSSATSRPDGSFEFPSLQEGEYTLQAGTTKHDRTVPTGTHDVRLTFIAVKPRRVEGRVEDGEGNPVAAGRVRVWYGKDGNRRSSLRADISAGYFRTNGDVKQDAVDIEVTAAFDAAGRALNFLPERVKDVDLAGGAPIVLKLSAGLEIRGRVVDANGGPVPGVIVTGKKKGSRNFYWPGQRGSRSVRSGEDGTFRLIGLKDEELSLSAAPGGRWVTPEDILARPGGGEVEFRLSQGGGLAGKVLTVDGEPIPGAQIWLNETEASRTSRGVPKQPTNAMAQYRHHRTCGADGSFEVEGLPENALYNVTASVQNQERAFVSETLRDVATGTRDLLLQLREGVTIRGTIEGPNGETVRAAWLQARPVEKKSGLKSANGSLNAQTNEFSVGPLQPGRYMLSIHVQDNRWSSPPAVEVNAPAEGLHIVVQPTRKLEGTLSGTDVKGFRVMFSVKGRATNGMVREDGRFTITGAGSGRGHLFAHRAGDSRYALLEDVDAASGPFTLNLQEGMTITGRVQGLPENSKGGQVWALRDGYWLQGAFKASGDFELLGLPPGEYQISGWISGGQIVAVEKVQAGAAGVTLTFKAQGR